MGTFAIGKVLKFSGLASPIDLPLLFIGPSIPAIPCALLSYRYRKRISTEPNTYYSSGHETMSTRDVMFTPPPAQTSRGEMLFQQSPNDSPRTTCAVVPKVMGHTQNTTGPAGP